MNMTADSRPDTNMKMTSKLPISGGKERIGTDAVSQLTSSLDLGKRKRLTESDSRTTSQVSRQVPVATTYAAKRSKHSSGKTSALVETTCSNDFYLYGLTASVWRRVFGYLPPATLARLLRVSRSINSLLMTHPQEFLPNDITDNSATLPESEIIWRRCHRLFAPGVPFPAQGQTELSMWQLIKGNRCQHCGQKKPLQTATEAPNVWSAGPGTEHVRVLWPFLARLCGRCLREQSQKEKDLLLSNTLPSFLIDELPFMFTLEPGDCVSQSVLRDNTVPLGPRLSKIFYKPQIARLIQTYHHFAQASLSSLDAWIESLTSSRTVQAQDSERWESWEAKGILKKINRATSKSLPDHSKLLPRLIGSDDVTMTAAKPSSNNSEPGLEARLSYKPQKLSCCRAISNQHIELSARRSDIGIRPKNVETSGSESKIREARRNEIVERCSHLNPPIGLELLDQMKSFHMSLQIEKEIDDQQWGILKERLIAERAAVDSRSKILSNTVDCIHGSEEHEAPNPKGNEQNLARQTTSSLPMLIFAGARRPVNASEQSTVYTTDKIQEELANFARTIIRNDWNEGNSLSKDACSQFAAEVLVRTRDAYLATSVDTARPVATPSYLTMEHMKWLFESFVKPLTEQYQKEIFLCRGCENTTKTYGFEAVVQHYAAKHTNSLSLGSAIVHWKAEWPPQPPFHPNPMRVKAHAIIVSTSNNSQIHLNKSSDILGHRDSYNTEFEIQRRACEPRSISMSSPQLTNRTTPFPKQTESSSHPSVEPQSLLSRPFLINSSTTRHHNVEHIKQDIPVGNNRDVTFVDTPFTSRRFHTSSATAGNLVTSVTMPTTEVFRAHQAEMAKFARELWFATAGIKGLPGPLRVQVIIHHASERFAKCFGVEPGVNMFLFGLNHEAAMRPLRSLNGFSCRACANGQPGSLPSFEQKKSQTLPHLLNHFMASHAEYYRLDWRRDMIQLPALRFISDLANAPGMDDAKISLFTTAFPGAFPLSFPSLTSLQQNTYSSVNHCSAGDRPDNMYPSIDRTAERDASYNSDNSIPRVERVINSLDYNEYDPQRPSYLGRMVDSQWNENISPGYISSTGQDVMLGRQSVDADRFLEALKPHLGAAQAQQSVPRHRTETSHVYHDEMYTGDKADKDMYASHPIRALRPFLTRSVDQQPLKTSLCENPGSNRYRSSQEYGSEIEPIDRRKAGPYYCASDGTVPGGIFQSPAAAYHDQQSMIYHKTTLETDISVGQYAESQRLRPEDTQHISHHV